MDIVLREKADLMAENYKKLKEGFRWDMNLLRHFGAMVHAIKGQRVSIDSLEKIKKHIKDETSWVSNFRGTNIFILTNFLYFEDDYKTTFRNMEKVYDKLKNEGFKNSTYLPLAAYTIAKEVPDDQWDYRIKRMRHFYDNMKKNHFWLTSADDYVFAAVLATTDLEVEGTSEKIEGCYRLLNEKGFYKGNDLQTLSHILALGEEEIKVKCSKTMELYEGLKEKKMKLQYSGLASLGVLTLISSDVDKTINEIKEVYDYIYEKDGYGFWSLDKNMRVILAANLVADYYVEGIKNGVLQVTLANSINAIIIAQQQAAVAAACAASTAAASTAN